MRRCYRLLFIACAMAQLSLLAGCSHTSERAATAETATSAATGEPAIPQVALEPQLLYQLLVAEFAGQQGALKLSASAYLETAKQTRDYRLARRATRIAIYGRQNRLALEAARLWVELEPQAYEAHKSAAALLVASGQQQEARPHLEQLLQSTQQDDNHGYLLVASILANDPDKTRALATMAELSALQPQNADAKYAHAHLAKQLGDDKTATTLLTQLLRQHPDHNRGRILFAQVQHALGDTQGALNSMEEAVRREPDNHQLRLTYARMLVDARQLKKARKQFTILNKATPNDADVVYALGLLALEAGELSNATQHFNVLLKHGIREEESRFAMAQIAEAQQQPEKAITWYQSIGEGERYIEAQLQAARLIAKHRGLDEAQHYLRGLPTETDDDRANIYLAEAELLNDAERFDEAMQVYNEGLARLPQNQNLLYSRAITAEKLDRLDILERDLQAILKQDPNNSRALNALGYTLADRTERYQEALGYIERAYRQRPDDFAILDSMGWVLYRLGRLEEALQFLQRAAAKVQDGEIAAHLGEVLWHAGKQQEARTVWKEALKFAPQHKMLQQTIQRFQP